MEERSLCVSTKMLRSGRAYGMLVCSHVCRFLVSLAAHVFCNYGYPRRGFCGCCLRFITTTNVSLTQCSISSVEATHCFEYLQVGSTTSVVM
jgi:hypothetical protein